MKKFNLIVAALILFLSAAVFAQEPVVELNPVLSGEAKLEISFDLDRGDVDLVNATKANITIEFVKKTNVDKGATEGLVGWIRLKDIQVGISTDSGKQIGFDSSAGDPSLSGTKAPVLTAKTGGVQARLYILGKPLYVEVSDVSNDVNFDTFEKFSVRKDNWTPATTAKTDGAKVERTVSNVELKGGGDASITIGTENGIVNGAVTLTNDDTTGLDEASITANDRKDDVNSFNIKAGVDFVAVPGLSVKAAFLFDPVFELSAGGSTAGSLLTTNR